MIDLDQLTTREALRDGAIEEHEQLRIVLWDHFVRLENNVSVLEDIVAFPGFKMMGSAWRPLDWMAQSVYEYTVMVLWRVWDSSDSRSITLNRLRQFLWNKIRDEYRDELKTRLRELRPSPELRDIFGRTQVIRHGRLAHIDEGYHLDEVERRAGISVGELRTATDYMTGCFNRLQFSTHSDFELASLRSRDHSPSSTASMMEALVIAGPYVTQYEEVTSDHWWSSWGDRLNSAESQWLSDLRVRYGLEALSPRPD